MYDNMTRCLDTLNELVQGPCAENQIAVAESKFFEIASDLFTQKYFNHYIPNRKEKDKHASGTMSTATMSASKS
jgi:inositol 1,4,5-triphosphate receptor type 1/inositol 1,4,5-triphosphate receptor type 3